MGAYILRRLLLMVPTIFGIMAVSCLVIQFAPGGPVEQVIAKLSGQGSDMLSGGGGDNGQAGGGGESSQYRGAQGLDPAFIKQLEAQFGFDQPWYTRFFGMLGSYLRFDFGESFFRDISVLDLIIEKMPVSISLGPQLVPGPFGPSVPCSSQPTSSFTCPTRTQPWLWKRTLAANSDFAGVSCM